MKLRTFPKKTVVSLYTRRQADLSEDGHILGCFGDSLATGRIGCVICVCVRYLEWKGPKQERRQTGKQPRKMLRRKNRKIIAHSTCVVTQLIYCRLLRHNSPKRKKTCWLRFPFRFRNTQACVETVPCSVFARCILHSNTFFCLSHDHLPLYSRIDFQLTLRLLMSYIYGAPILDVSRSHTTTHHSR